MVLTILRTYYNVCLAYKSDGTVETSAQRLGVTNKILCIKDIIYMQ